MLTGGTTNDAAEGGFIKLSTGHGESESGKIELQTADRKVNSNGVSGQLLLRTGTTTNGASGAVLIASGKATGATSGTINIFGGESTSTSSANVHLRGGQTSNEGGATGGNVLLSGGQSEFIGNGGNVLLRGGSANNGIGGKSKSMGVHHNYQQGDPLQLKAVRIITQTQQQALVAYRSNQQVAEL